MSFNIALSGLNAASNDLRITGNNIANASTVGFKSSRAEFADVYASSNSSSSTQIGSGVKMTRAAQQFEQGTITFTENSLDLAIDGKGFFILSDEGSQIYTRAGSFGLDDQGYIVSAAGARVQGFGANDNGSLSGILGDLQVNANSLPPSQTTLVEASVNLDARASVLSQLGSSLNTEGVAVGVPQLGIPVSTPTTLETAGPPTPFDFSVNTVSSVSGGNAITPFDFSGAAASTFDVQLQNSSVPSENIAVTITLDSNINSLQDLITEIRDDLSGTGIGIDVREDPNATGRIQFFATTTGDDSIITIDPNDDDTGFGTGVTQADIEAVLGGLQLGSGGAGSSSSAANPNGGSANVGVTGSSAAGSFDLTLTDSSGNNGTVTLTLDADITDAASLVSELRPNLLASALSVDIRLDPDDNSRVEFFSTIEGEPSTISISGFDASNSGVTTQNIIDALNLDTGVSVDGVAGAGNGYVAQSVDIAYPDGSTRNISVPSGSSAAETAAIFASANVPGVGATATTTAVISASGYTNTSGSMEISINNISVPGNTLDDISNAINLGVPGLTTVSAVIDEQTGDLVVTDAVGNDLVFGATGGNADTLEIRGLQSGAEVLDTSGNNVVTLGGRVEFVLEEGVTFENPVPAITNLFGNLGPSAYTEFALRTFDPSDQDTYNAATSLTIYDSLGNPHALSLYFIKERFTPGVLGEEENRWSMYALIDGQDVGDPDPNLPPPQNVEPSRTKYRVRFNTDGTLNPSGTDPILISNWTPADDSGNPNGATGPLNVLGGGALPIVDPPISSNFEIRLGDSTQFGRDFSLGSIEQDGHTTGKLSGLQFDAQGVITARFTNGQTSVLGQIGLADFNNTQGLQNIGNTGWVETNVSGAAVIGTPSAGTLGTVNAGALEDSNVDLSKQLVQLIIAQRNFQANSRTITTADEVTQTIVNI